MKINHEKVYCLLLALYKVVEMVDALNATANCPCLTISSASNDIFVEAKATMSFLAINVSSRALYGINCYQHDNVSPCEPIEQQRNDEAPFCTSFWCYVDESCAGAESQVSKIRRSPENIARRYSHATCGDIDRYSTTLLHRELIGVDTRVMYMKNSGG